MRRRVSSPARSVPRASTAASTPSMRGRFAFCSPSILQLARLPQHSMLGSDSAVAANKTGSNTLPRPQQAVVWTFECCGR